jgi:hypothetical protein
VAKLSLRVVFSLMLTCALVKEADSRS